MTMNEDGFVLIGPNGWPIVGIVVFMAFVGWWFAQSGKPPRQGPTFWEGVRWSALKAVFPGVHAWYVSSVSGEREREDEEELPARTNSEPTELKVIRSPLYQVDTDTTEENEPEREPERELSLRKLSRTEEITLLATQRDDDGRYRHSANKIADFMGGTRAEVLAIIAEVRGKKESPPMRRSPTALRRPQNGWR
jgi:hypothetical protein